MCTIVDASVRDQVFGKKRPEAGKFFFDWLNRGKGKPKLVIGGKLRQELSGSGNFDSWLQAALLAGRAKSVSDKEVDNATKELENLNICKSNDQHVLALARVSGARLLFANDGDLQSDFGNRTIVGGVRGRVYSTKCHKHVTSTHKQLLRRSDLCGT